MTAARLLETLDGVRRSGSGWQARCPAHDDQVASLAIRVADDGRTLLHCHAGCATEDVVAAVGLTLSDLFTGDAPPQHEAPHARPRLVASYDYRAADGTLLYQACRYAPKGFRQRRPDGAGGWTWNLDGVTRVLYRLPGLVASPMSEMVVIAEGEKDVDALVALGLTATCNPGGAGKWRAEYAEHLRGRMVVVLPDNDEAGRRHADQVARSLVGVAAAVKIVALPGLAPKGDVSDWLAAGGTRERLVALADAAAPFEAEAADALRWRTAAEIAAATPQEVDWVASPLVARGAVTDVVSRPKTGKSTMLAHLASAVLDGAPFLGQVTTRSPVVWLTEEADPTFRALLARADLLDRTDLHVLSYGLARAVDWPDVVAAAVQKATGVGAGMVVVDTLPAWARLPADSENDAGTAMSAVEPLRAAAADHGLAIVIVRHARKGGGDVADAGRGSSAFAGAVDTMMVMSVVADHPTWRRIRAVSRFDATPPELLIELTELGYVILDEEEARDAGHSAQRGRVLAALPEAHAEAVTVEDVRAATGLAGSTLRELAKSLVDARAASRYRESGRAPYLYHRGDCPRCRRVATTPRDTSTPARDGSSRSDAHSSSIVVVGGASGTPPPRAAAVVDPYIRQLDSSTRRNRVPPNGHDPDGVDQETEVI